MEWRAQRTSSEWGSTSFGNEKFFEVIAVEIGAAKNYTLRHVELVHNFLEQKRFQPFDA